MYVPLAFVRKFRCVHTYIFVHHDAHDQEQKIIPEKNPCTLIQKNYKYLQRKLQQ